VDPLDLFALSFFEIDSLDHLTRDEFKDYKFYEDAFEL